MTEFLQADAAVEGPVDGVELRAGEAEIGRLDAREVSEDQEVEFWG